MGKKIKVLCVEHLDNSRKVANFINEHRIQKDDILLLEHTSKEFYALFYYKEEEE